MTAQDFLDWMDRCGLKSAAAVGDALGLGRNAAARYVSAAKAGKPVDLTRYVQLAMSAYAMRLPPWGERKDQL